MKSMYVNIHITEVLGVKFHQNLSKNEKYLCKSSCGLLSKVTLTMKQTKPRQNISTKLSADLAY